MDVSQVNRQLGREWAWRELRKRQSFSIITFLDPLAVLDKVAMHIAHKRHRSAKPERAELEKISCQVRQRIRRGVRRLPVNDRRISTQEPPSMISSSSASYRMDT